MHERDRKPDITSPNSQKLRPLSPKPKPLHLQVTPKPTRFSARTESDEKQCTNCGETDTPQWRGTLCNACALWRRSRGTNRPLPLMFRARKRGRSDSSGSAEFSRNVRDGVEHTCEPCGTVKDERQAELVCGKCEESERWRLEKQRMMQQEPCRPGPSYHRSSYSLPRPPRDRYISPSPNPEEPRPRPTSPLREWKAVPRGTHFPPRIAALLERTQRSQREGISSVHEQIMERGGDELRDMLRSDTVQPELGLDLSPSPVPRRMPVQDGFGFGLTREEWMDSALWLWEVVERAGLALEGVSRVD